jgi:indole-3-glycerol phosphate synthase
MSVLDKIVARKQIVLREAKQKTPYAVLESKRADCPPTRGFARAIRGRKNSKIPALIAEIKKGSPSKGLIREQYDPASHARDYQTGGASCLSVLTDEHFFGTDDHFRQACEACSLPMLRKDFMIDPWQILQSRIMGADCILLILAILDDEQAKSLSALAFDIGLDVLVETHDKTELERAKILSEDCLIGINNRNLHDFVTDISVTDNLIQHLPASRLIVSESGIGNAQDVRRVACAGASAVLVGESLMRQENLVQATQNLLDM